MGPSKSSTRTPLSGRPDPVRTVRPSHTADNALGSPCRDPGATLSRPPHHAAGLARNGFPSPPRNGRRIVIIALPRRPRPEATFAATIARACDHPQHVRLSEDPECSANRTRTYRLTAMLWESSKEGTGTGDLATRLDSRAPGDASAVWQTPRHPFARNRRSC